MQLNQHPAPLYARVNAKLKMSANESFEWLFFPVIFFFAIRVQMKQWQECVFFVKFCIHMHCATSKRDVGGKAIYFANWFSSFCSDSWSYTDLVLDQFSVKKSNNKGVQTAEYHHLLFNLLVYTFRDGESQHSPEISLKLI